MLRDPAEAAADVAKLVELAALGVALVRWRKGGPRPTPDGAEFWAAGAADLAGEFLPDMPRLVNSVALRIAGKLARMAVALAHGAVARTPTTATPGQA